MGWLGGGACRAIPKIYASLPGPRSEMEALSVRIGRQNRRRRRIVCQAGGQNWPGPPIDSLPRD